MNLELEVQFQLAVVSVVFSLVFSVIYKWISIIFSRIKLVKGILVFFLFFSFAVLYYFVIYKISNGVITIYLPLFLGLGCYIYAKFYDKYFSCLFECQFLKISSIIEIRKERYKKKWIEYKLKRKKEKENLTD